MNTIMRKILISLFILLPSCSTNYYKAVETGESAYVSFSNLSFESPEIIIITGCEQSKIENKYIQYKKPSENSYMRLPVPSNQPVTFVYRYTWFDDKTTQLVTKQIRANSYIQENTEKGINSCDEEFTFIPEPNKYYEVYFGNNAASCLIKVSETLFDSRTRKKLLFKIEQVPGQKCQKP